METAADDGELFVTLHPCLSVAGFSCGLAAEQQGIGCGHFSGCSTWRVEDSLGDAGYAPEGYSSIPGSWHAASLWLQSKQLQWVQTLGGSCTSPCRPSFLTEPECNCRFTDQDVLWFLGLCGSSAVQCSKYLPHYKIHTL